MSTDSKMVKADRWARWSYDQLRILQPHIDTRGLYQIGTRFLIHVPNFGSQLALDGKPIVEWFMNNKAMTSPVDISDVIPTEAVAIENRTALELAWLAGSPRTVAEVVTELNLLLGVDFPLYRFRDFPPHIGIIEVERKLDPQEQKELQEALESLQLDIKWEVAVKNDFDKMKEVPLPQKQGNVELLTARFPALGRSTKQLQRLIESDEEFWVDSGRKILAGEVPTQSVFEDSESHKIVSSTLNGSTFQTDNVRNHLCLFEQTNLIFPISQNYNDALKSLGITESELVSLIGEKRITAVLPLSIERYPLRLLDQLAEVAPQQVLMPRKLTAGLLTNNRKRFPFLFPPCSIEQRQHFLRAILDIREKLVGTPLKVVFDIYCEFLRENWSHYEWVYNRRGPLALQTHGMGALIGSFTKAVQNQDASLELGYSDLGIGIASTLNSTYFPHEGSDTWSEESISSIMASVYSGGPGQILYGFQRRLNVALDGLLSVRKDVPVLELAKVMGGADINRLRRMIFQLASDKSVDTTQMETHLNSYNEEVRNVEKKIDRLAKWDIGSVMLSTPGALVGISEPFIGFLLSFLGQRLSKEIPELRAKHPLAGSVIDVLEGMVVRSHPDKVFLARLRRQIDEV